MPRADKALAKGRASDERWHMRKDGSRLWASGVMMPMRDRRGEAIGFVKIFRDRTAELRAKEALENALKETERASFPRRSLSRAADATHTGAHVDANTFAPQGLAASRH
jgi:two-component system, chemotaxis family, CheB/CheR fusion protein